MVPAPSFFIQANRRSISHNILAAELGLLSLAVSAGSDEMSLQVMPATRALGIQRAPQCPVCVRRSRGLGLDPERNETPGVEQTQGDQATGKRGFKASKIRNTRTLHLSSTLQSSDTYNIITTVHSYSALHHLQPGIAGRNNSVRSGRGIQGPPPHGLLRREEGRSQPLRYVEIALCPEGVTESGRARAGKSSGT